MRAIAIEANASRVRIDPRNAEPSACPACASSRARRRRRWPACLHRTRSSSVAAAPSRRHGCRDRRAAAWRPAGRQCGDAGDGSGPARAARRARRRTLAHLGRARRCHRLHARLGGRPCRSRNGDGPSHERRGRRLPEGRRHATRCSAPSTPCSVTTAWRKRRSARWPRYRSRRTSRGLVAAARMLGLPLLVPDAVQLTQADARCLTRSAASMAATGLGSACEAAALAACGPGATLLGPRIIHRRHNLRHRIAEPNHDGSFHRRRTRRRRPHHGARARSHRQLPGLPLRRVDRAAGTARLVPARRPHRRHGADVARRDRGRIPCRRMQAGRTSRGCIPATCRSGVRSPNRSGGWSATASPTR